MMRHLDLFEKLYQTGYGSKILFGGNRTRLLVLSKRMEHEIASKNIPEVLDMGCGVGLFSLIFARTGGTITGMDPSRTAIKKATKNAKSIGLTNAFFLVSSAEYLPFRSMCFDICFHSEVLEHVINPELAIRETARVLKEGGSLLASIPCANKYSFEWFMSKLTGKLFRVKNDFFLFYLDLLPKIGHPMFRRFTDSWTRRCYLKYKVLIRGIEYHGHFFTPLIEFIYHTVKPTLREKSMAAPSGLTGSLLELLDRICRFDYVLLRRVPSGSNMLLYGSKMKEKPIESERSE